MKHLGNDLLSSLVSQHEARGQPGIQRKSGHENAAQHIDQAQYVQHPINWSKRHIGIFVARPGIGQVSLGLFNVFPLCLPAATADRRAPHAPLHARTHP